MVYPQINNKNNIISKEADLFTFTLRKQYENAAKSNEINLTQASPPPQQTISIPAIQLSGISPPSSALGARLGLVHPHEGPYSLPRHSSPSSNLSLPVPTVTYTPRIEPSRLVRSTSRKTSFADDHEEF